MCKRNLVCVVLAVSMLLVVTGVIQAATEAEITAAIDAGVAWLVANQNADGSWGWWNVNVAQTALAVVKLQDRARELQTTDYDDAIQDGLDYIFSQATVGPYGPGSGICFWVHDYESYSTGLAMMAIANDGDTSQTTMVAPFTGETYAQILEGCVEYLAFAQNLDGAWSYEYHAGGAAESDQSNSGYVTLGLSYAEDAGIAIPASIKTGLTNWINAIQDPVNGDSQDGGSWYTTTWSWVNVLKTGNLIYQMTFVGIGPGDPRFDAAIDYIERHWLDANYDPGWGYNFGANDYQAMYCLMKGLQYSGVDEIDYGFGLEDWFNQDPPAIPAQDLASNIVAEQNVDGSWTDNNWGDTQLGTCWALLTLEKVTPPPPEIEVYFDIKPGSCPNPFNSKSQGSVPMAVVGSDEYDWMSFWPSGPEAVVLSLVVIKGDANSAPILPNGILEVVDSTEPDGENNDCYTCFNADENYNYDSDGDGILDTYIGDGYLDLVIKFDTQDIVTAIAEELDGAEKDECVQMMLLGETESGIPIIGYDSMRMLKKINGD